MFVTNTQRVSGVESRVRHIDIEVEVFVRGEVPDVSVRRGFDIENPEKPVPAFDLKDKVISGLKILRHL